MKKKKRKKGFSEKKGKEKEFKKGGAGGFQEVTSVHE